MKSECIYRAIGDVDDNLLERCEAVLPAKNAEMAVEKRGVEHQRYGFSKWCRLGVAAACLCLIVTGGYFADFNPSGNGAATVIENFTGKTPDSGVYSPPEDGTLLLFRDVKAALKKHKDEKCTYFLALDIFEKGSLIELKGEKERQEVERLRKAGYEIGYAKTWTYQGDGEKVDMPYLAGYFTEEQIQVFSANQKYGYTLRFMEDADGNPVPSNQKLEIPVVTQ